MKFLKIESKVPISVIDIFLPQQLHLLNISLSIHLNSNIIQIKNFENNHKIKKYITADQLRYEVIVWNFLNKFKYEILVNQTIFKILQKYFDVIWYFSSRLSVNYLSPSLKSFEKLIVLCDKLLMCHHKLDLINNFGCNFNLLYVIREPKMFHIKELMPK